MADDVVISNPDLRSSVDCTLLRVTVPYTNQFIYKHYIIQVSGKINPILTIFKSYTPSDSPSNHLTIANPRRSASVRSLKLSKLSARALTYWA